MYLDLVQFYFLNMCLNDTNPIYIQLKRMMRGFKKVKKYIESKLGPLVTKSCPCDWTSVNKPLLHKHNNNGLQEIGGY